MIDYRNLNTMATLSEILQINEPISQVPQISVWHWFINNLINCYLELKFVNFKLKLKAALFIDSILAFTRQVNHLIGPDSNRLFGIDGVSLKNSEIHIGSQRGINCSLNSLSVESWPLGTVVLKSLIKVNIKKWPLIFSPKFTGPSGIL